MRIIQYYTIKCIQMYGQSIAHQNNLHKGIFFSLKILYDYISASQTGADRIFMSI